MLKKTILIGSIGAALVFAGCGGDSDSLPAIPVSVVSTTEDPGSLSTDEVISQGDSICAEVNTAVGSLSTSSTDAGGQLAQRADIYRGMLERLQGLGGADNADYADVLSSGKALVLASKEAATAAEQNNGASSAVAEATVASALADFKAAASNFGFTECGDTATSPIVPGTSSGGTTTVAPAPVPVTPAAPAGDTGGVAPDTGTGGTGGTGGDSGGGSAGSGGIGPG